MKMEASNKVAINSTKPKIKKGYYKATLSEVKPRQDKEGNWIEGKYGRQIILLFGIFTNEEKPVPIMDPNNPTDQLILAQVLNSEYKDKDGSYRTAVTKNARITHVFETLGWVFDPKGFDTDEFVGKWCEVNIDDYDAKSEDGDTYKASTIVKINALEDEAPKDVPVVKPSEPQKVVKQVSSEEVVTHSEGVKEEKVGPTLTPKQIESIEGMTKMNKEGMLSDEGLVKAIEQIENGG